MSSVFVLLYHRAMKTVQPRPPEDRGQGRKPLVEGEETVTVSIRVTVSQRAKLALLGGADWVRKRIDKAKLP